MIALSSAVCPTSRMDQSRSALPLRSDKAREFGELQREQMCARTFELSFLIV